MLYGEPALAYDPQKPRDKRAMINNLYEKIRIAQARLEKARSEDVKRRCEEVIENCSKTIEKAKRSMVILASDSHSDLCVIPNTEHTR